jgi:hypothetical protein
MKTLPASALFLALIAASSLSFAATVRVDFVTPDQYTDVDRFSDESKRAMQAIQKTLVDLGNRYLPQDATLRVEVQDVDLAGKLVHSARAGRDIRVERGLDDPPMIKLHYVLEEGGRVVMDKDESVNGLAYLRQSNVRASGESFPYEKAMLEQWFRDTFAAKPAASGK